MADTWQALGPILADDGWCVYGLNYGASATTTLSGGRIWSVGDIPTSAGQLATFVGQVRATTGASKVDLVGWSQGGMMPPGTCASTGGPPHVHDLVGLAPSNHGTTVDGTERTVRRRHRPGVARPPHPGPVSGLHPAAGGVALPPAAERRAGTRCPGSATP